MKIFSTKFNFMIGNRQTLTRYHSVSYLLLFVFVFLPDCMGITSAYSNTQEPYRGINIAFKSIPHRAKISEKELDKFKEWGVDTIRLSIRTTPNARGYGNFYSSDESTFNESAFKKLDIVLNMAANRKISVIIATPAFSGSINGDIWRDYKHWEKLRELWTYIARRYKDHSAVIGYHPIDESNVVTKFGTKIDYFQMRRGKWKFPEKWKNTPKNYFLLVERIGQAINLISPDKFVVVTSVGLGGKAINYNWMEPVKVNNVIYAFNFYVPSKFANSGKNGKPVVPYVQNKDLSKIIGELSPVKAFAKKYNTRILVSGFGIPYYTEGIGAKNWMNDVIGFFEKNSWSWLYFSYSAILRSPDLIPNKSTKKLERSQNTERLSVLKQYWN